LEKLKKIIEEKFTKVIIELDYVGAKKASRDIVKRNLDELQVELEKALSDDAEKLRNKLIISVLENTLEKARLVAGE
jgi:hypothetical protein